MGPKNMDDGDFDFPIHAFWRFIFLWITDAHMFQRDLKEQNEEMS